MTEAAADDLETQLRKAGFIAADGKPPKKKKTKKKGGLRRAFATVAALLAITGASGAASYAATSAIEGHPAPAHGGTHATAPRHPGQPKNSNQP